MKAKKQKEMLAEVDKKSTRSFKKMPKINTQDTRHGKMDLPNFKPRKTK